MLSSIEPQGTDTRSGIVGAISADIVDAYLADDHPWVLGFSGGKDSTALLQWAALAGRVGGLQVEGAIGAPAREIQLRLFLFSSVKPYLDSRSGDFNV